MSFRNALCLVRSLRLAIPLAIVLPLLLGCALLAGQPIGGTKPTSPSAYSTLQQPESTQRPMGAPEGQGAAGANVLEGEDNVWAKCPEGETVETVSLCFDHYWTYAFPPNGSTDVMFNTPHCIKLHIGSSGVWGDDSDLRYTVSGKSIDSVAKIQMDMIGHIYMTPDVRGECIANPDPNKGDNLHLKTREVWGDEILHAKSMDLITGNMHETNLDIPGPATQQTDLNFKLISYGETRITIPWMGGELVYILCAYGCIPLEPLVTPP
jgi:hypothetical protein